MKITLGFCQGLLPWFQHRVNHFHLFQEAHEHKSIFGQLKNGKIIGLSGQFGVQSGSSQKPCEDCRRDLHLLKMNQRGYAR